MEVAGRARVCGSGATLVAEDSAAPVVCFVRQPRHRASGVLPTLPAPALPEMGLPDHARRPPVATRRQRPFMYWQYSYYSVYVVPGKIPHTHAQYRTQSQKLCFMKTALCIQYITVWVGVCSITEVSWRMCFPLDFRARRASRRCSTKTGERCWYAPYIIRIRYEV